MKKLILIFYLVGLTSLSFADTKLSALTADTTAQSTDLLYKVDNPSGTPFSRSISVRNLLSQVAVSSFQVSGVSSGTYGSATQVSSITVNSQGIITGAANVTISISTTNMNASGASANTFLRADNTWTTPVGYTLEPATVTARMDSGMTSSTFTVNIGGSRVAVFTSTGSSVRGNLNNSVGNNFDIGYSSECVGPETGFSASSAYQDFCYVVISSGDWMFTGFFYFENGGASVTKIAGGITTETGNNCALCIGGNNYFEGPPTTSSYQSTAVIPNYHRNDLTNGTTFYLKGYSTYTGGPPFLRSRITAIRIR